MNTTPAPSCPRERGFILVGVVMFVLALTILGLSLYGLSSYEAQFFQTTQDRDQALYDAQGGQEIVKALLLKSPYKLENSQAAIGQRGILSAIAYQQKSSNLNDTTSRGPVNWDSTVTIMITARSGKSARTIRAAFVPQQKKSPYKHLITTNGLFTYNRANSGNSKNTVLRGPIWQHVVRRTDLDWQDDVSWPVGGPVDSSTAPTALAADFVGAHVGTATVAVLDTTSLINIHRLRLLASGPDISYFKSPLSPRPITPGPWHSEFTFFEDHEVQLEIRGTVVWVVPAGAAFDNLVTVTALQSNSVLVIVALRNGRHAGFEDRAIWFRAGLVSDDPSRVKIFLVSDDLIQVSHTNRKNESHDADAISFFGANIWLEGPVPGKSFRLTYDGSMDDVVDELVARGGLPSSSGITGGTFTMVPYTWREP